jgi:hypothetical protein
MFDISQIEQRANAYIEEHTASSGVPFPITGIRRTLVIKCMAAFACRELARELTDLFEGEPKQ